MANKDDVISDYEKGLPIKEIARRHGVTPSYVSLVARRAGLAMRLSDAARARLSARASEFGGIEQRALLEAYDAGEPVKVIAARFGTDVSYVSKLARKAGRTRIVRGGRP